MIGSSLAEAAATLLKMARSTSDQGLSARLLDKATEPNDWNRADAKLAGDVSPTALGRAGHRPYRSAKHSILNHNTWEKQPCELLQSPPS